MDHWVSNSIDSDIIVTILREVTILVGLVGHLLMCSEGWLTLDNYFDVCCV